MTISWLRQQWVIHRRASRICSAASLMLLTFLLWLIIVDEKKTIGGGADPEWIRANLKWADPKWMKEIDHCQSTRHKPFRAGCPSSCRRAVGNETMYRVTVEWYFGQPILFDESELPNAYDKGINYQCPREFVQNFIQASQRITGEVKAKIPNIMFKLQARMHMSLVYLCCLRRNETDWVREIVHNWVNQHRPFDFTVNFNKLECWHERHNSVTNIIVGDDATQQTVMKFVHSLYKTLVARGIPMEVTREQQMPIHSTIVGIQYGEGEGQPEDDIGPQLAAIHDIVAPISKEFGVSWTGSRQGRMRVTHDPFRPVSVAWHAGDKPST